METAHPKPSPEGRQEERPLWRLTQGATKKHRFSAMLRCHITGADDEARTGSEAIRKVNRPALTDVPVSRLRMLPRPPAPTAALGRRGNPVSGLNGGGGSEGNKKAPLFSDASLSHNWSG